MSLALKRTAGPALEPVSLAAMKAHLNIEASVTDDDDLISGMISAARSDAEDYTGRSLVSQGWVYALDRFPVYRMNDRAPSRSDFDGTGNLNYAGFRIEQFAGN